METLSPFMWDLMGTLLSRSLTISPLSANNFNNFAQMKSLPP